MKKLGGVFLTAALWLFLLVPIVWAQPKPHGDQRYEKKGIHSGNRIRTTFYNSGFVGRVGNVPEDIGGEWPINSGHEYIGDMLVMVGSEIKDIHGQVRHSVVTPRGPMVSARTGDRSDDGTKWYTWEPLPGYANPDTNLVAMSHLPISWPPYWPDKMDDVVDPGWPGSWNGYFGKNVFNADQESYYVMDDYNDARYDFYPDSTDLSRRGLGIQGAVRGFQWSHPLAQDVLFQVYDFTNIGTYPHEKMVFGIIWGGMVGGDGEDDNASFDINDNITYTWDFDNIGAGGWSPVGWAACAFLESPGNSWDGIDNDGDGANGPGKTIDESLFAPRQLQAGDPVVVIDYDTFERTVVTMPADSLVVPYRYLGEQRELVFHPGDTVEEIPRNLIDDNLNGLIDENNGSSIEIAPSVYQTTYLYTGLKYIDYVTGEGKDNLLIDERRDDGIDNDGDWDPVNDDVGLDGAFNTGDPGEGDGVPTSGAGTDLPGEPHIDKTDITESDQLGLTSFYFFYPFNLFSLREDEKIWKNMEPGYFNSTAQNVDGDFIYGSGYFPLRPGETERVSVAVIFGWNKEELLRTKRTVQKIYDENYNFAKAPRLPKVWAVAGDGEVTIYWDDAAEYSWDVLSGYDFEGYKIYRSSDPGFQDALPVTDAFGSRKLDAPMAQFDKIDGIKGFFPIGYDGTQFYLGDDTGLVHSFRDTTVQNGHTYFYAVTAYDHGEASLGILPSETSKYATIDRSGKIETAQNVVAVRPEAPVAGFVAPEAVKKAEKQPCTIGTGEVYLQMVDETRVKDGHVYEIRFYDTSSDGLDNDGDWDRMTDDVGADGVPGTGDLGEGDGKPTRGEPNVDLRDPDEFVPITSEYEVLDITDPANPVQLFKVPFVEVIKRGAEADTVADRIHQDKDGSRDFFDGLRFNIKNDWEIRRIPDQSNWNIIHPDRPQNYKYSFSVFEASGIYTRGVPYPVYYKIAFFDTTENTSDELTVYRLGAGGKPGAPVHIPSVPCNFKVIDGNTGEEAKFAFLDSPLRPSFISPGFLSNLDRIIFFEQVGDSDIVTWQVSFFGNDTTYHHPRAGDTLTIRTTAPFKTGDAFVAKAEGPKVDPEKAKAELARIKVVPNPYVAAATWEPRNPFETGRGPRELHFTHLPKKCTIRIYTVQGELVATIEHDSPLEDGTAEWNMLTKDNLDIAYGVYIYHIDAPGLGEVVGKFAVIK